MATTIFNNLNTKLSRKLNDTVATADLGGKSFSSAVRSDYLNQANIFIQSYVYNSDKSTDKKLARELLSTSVKTVGFPNTGGGAAYYDLATVASDYHLPLGVKITSDTNTYIYEPVKEYLENFTKFYLTHTWTIEGGTIYIYINGVATASTGTLIYLPKDEVTVVTTSGGTDIRLASSFHDVLVSLACVFALEEIGELDSKTAYEQRTAMMLQIMK